MTTENEQQTSAPAAAKAKVPRRDSTRQTAAQRIAETFGEPKLLMELLDGDVTGDDVVTALTAEIDGLTKSLAAKKAALRSVDDFLRAVVPDAAVGEKDLPQFALIAIRGVLDARIGK